MKTKKIRLSKSSIRFRITLITLLCTLLAIISISLGTTRYFYNTTLNQITGELDLGSTSLAGNTELILNNTTESLTLLANSTIVVNAMNDTNTLDIAVDSSFRNFLFSNQFVDNIFIYDANETPIYHLNEISYDVDMDDISRGLLGFTSLSSIQLNNSNEYVMTIVAPISSDTSDVVGTLCSTINLQKLLEHIIDKSFMAVEGADYYFMNTLDLNIIASTNINAIGETPRLIETTTDSVRLNALNDDEFFMSNSYLLGSNITASYSLSYDAFYAPLSNMINMIILSSIGLMILISIISTFIINKSLKPIVTATHLIDDISTLDFSSTDDYSHLAQNKDETGIMSRSIFDMINSLSTNISTILHNSENVENNALKTNSSTNTIARKITSLSESSRNVLSNFEDLSASSEEISATSLEVQSSIDNSVQRIISCADSAQDIIDTTNALRDNTLTSYENTKSIYDKVKSSSEESIVKSSNVLNSISNLTTLINDIASETDLIAINAAIEASREDMSNTGFHIIADQIRLLAVDSGSAVNEINTAIESVNNSIENLSLDMKNILSFLENTVLDDYTAMIELSNTYVNQINELNAVLQEVSDNANEFSASLQTINASIQENTCTLSEGTENLNDITIQAIDINNNIQHIESLNSTTMSNIDTLMETISKFKLKK